MFKKILLPLDLTDKHRRALDIAADLASPGGGEVTLLHVIEVIPGLKMEEERHFYNRLEEAARKHLKQCGEVLARRKVTSRGEIIFGRRTPEVARYARENGADLI